MSDVVIVFDVAVLSLEDVARKIPYPALPDVVIVFEVIILLVDVSWMLMP